MRTTRFMTRRLAVALLVLAAGFGSLGCERMGDEGGQGGEGPGHRKQTLAMAPEQELQAGRKAYREILSKARGHVLPADSVEVKRSRQVAARIIKAAGIEPLQREINFQLPPGRFEWEVNVIDDKQVNAFCLPAGKIVVYTGILQLAQDDDQLATVLGHEISHALAHHVSERIARERVDHSGGMLGKSFDRQQETEADHIGLFLMTFAGYDPGEAVLFWQAMSRHSQQAGGRLPEILSDHPSDEHRIRDLEKWVPFARKAKTAFDQGRIAPAGPRKDYKTARPGA